MLEQDKDDHIEMKIKTFLYNGLHGHFGNNSKIRMKYFRSTSICTFKQVMEYINAIVSY